MPSPPTAAPPGRAAIPLLASGATFLAMLDATVTNLAIPDLRHDFQAASVPDLTWVITLYALLFAALLAPAGRLADVLGRRTLFRAGIGLFTTMSLFCAIAPNLPTLLAARALQGAGAAAMIPASLAILLHDTPPERRVRAIGLWSRRPRRRGGPQPGRDPGRLTPLAIALLHQPADRAGARRLPSSSPPIQRAGRPAARRARHRAARRSSVDAPRRDRRQRRRRGPRAGHGISGPVLGGPDRSRAPAREPDLTYRNLGERNLLAAEVRERQLAPALALAPDLAIIACGGNDMLRSAFDADGVKRELDTMIGALRSTGSDVLTIGLVDITPSGIIPERYAPSMRAGIRRLGAITEEVAADHGALYISFIDHPASADPGIFSSDLLHLNARGHAIVAAETIRRLAVHLAPAG